MVGCWGILNSWWILNYKTVLNDLSGAEATLPDTVPGIREVSQEYDESYKSYADADGETDSIDVAHIKHGGADAIMSSLAEMLTADGEKKDGMSSTV